MTLTATIEEPKSALKEIQTAVRHGVVYGGGGVLAKALGFLMLPFYTHYLGPGDYGLLEILDLSVSLLGMIMHMGIAPALLRSYAAAESAEEKKKAVSTVFLFVGATGILTYLAALAFIRPLSVFLFGPEVPATYLLLSFSAFIVSYIAGPVRIYLRALEASGKLVFLDTVSTLAVLALNIFFIAGLKIGLLGILISPIIVNIVWLAFSTRVFLRIGIRFSESLLRQMVRFGFPLILSNLAAFVLNFSDRFFLQHFGSLEVVGLYAVGYKFGFMINFLFVQPFLVMWQSRMYAIQSNPQHAGIFSQIFVLYALLLTYAALTLALLSPEIVGIMAGPKFAAASAVIPIIALAYVACGIGGFLQTGLYLAGRTSLVGVISMVAALLSLVVNYVLILHFGMLGGAWATLISFSAIAVGSHWFAQKVFPLKLGLGRVALAILLGAGLYFVSSALTFPALGFALLFKLAVIVIFPLVLWKSGILSPAEVGTILAARGKLLARFPYLASGIFGRAANS